MWRVVVLLFAWSTVGRPAWAQSDPDQARPLPTGGTIGGAATTAPTSPPPSQPAGAPAPVATQPTVYDHSNARTVDRGGLLVLAGIELADSEPFLRADVYKPVPLAKAPRLHVGMVVSYFHDRVEIPELALEAYAFGFEPSVFYDWKLPIRSRAGDFVITAEGGLSLVFVRIKLDQPFMPGKYENARATGMRLASAVQFRARSGYIISLQYVGLGLPVGDPSAPPQYETHSKASIVFALMAGYQFR